MPKEFDTMPAEGTLGLYIAQEAAALYARQ